MITSQATMLSAIMESQSKTTAAMFSALTNKGGDGDSKMIMPLLLKMIERTPATATDDALKTIEQMKSIFDKDGGSEKSGIMDMLLPLLIEHGPKLLSLVTKQPVAVPMPGHPAPQKQIAQPAPAPAQFQPVVVDDFPPGFLKLAEKNADPGLGADFLITLWSEEPGKIGQFMKAATPEPEVFKPWIAEVRVELAKMIAEDQQEQPANPIVGANGGA